MSTDPDRITRNAVYAAKTLTIDKIVVGCLCALTCFMAWAGFTLTSAQTAVLQQIQVTLAIQNSAITEFIKLVGAQHQAQLDALKQIQSAVRQKQGTSVRTFDPSTIGGTP